LWILTRRLSASIKHSPESEGSFKSYGDWGWIFGDSILATAILDRLLHHSTTINIRGESYRLKDRRNAGLGVTPRTGRGGRRGSLRGLGLRYARNAPKSGAAPAMWFSRRRDAVGFAVRLASPDAMAVARDECTRATNFVLAGRRNRGELPWLQHLPLSFLSRGRTAELAATWKTILRRASTRLDV
jgi:IstB-like ATP binding protein